MYHVEYMTKERLFTDPIQVWLPHDEYLWLKREAELTETDYAKIVRMLITKYRKKRSNVR